MKTLGDGQPTTPGPTLAATAPLSARRTDAGVAAPGIRLPCSGAVDDDVASNGHARVAPRIPRTRASIIDHILDTLSQGNRT